MFSNIRISRRLMILISVLTLIFVSTGDDQQVMVENGRVTTYRVNLKVTFVLQD